MTDSPYRLETPAVVSFSGGRTSGFMLRNILDAFGGTLPADVKVVFANTGKERPETLDFVERVGQRWGVDVVWLEYRRWPNAGAAEKASWHCRPKKNGPVTGFDVVNYVTASRDGRPFNELISSKGMLPNVVKRYCTQWMKIKTSWRYARHVLGWKSYGNAIGFRADEPKRLAKLKPDPKSTPGEDPIAPMAAAGHRLTDVMRFWDLELRQGEGNCDLCFMKSADKTMDLMRARPDLSAWWAKWEEVFVGKTRRFAAARFRKDRAGYAALQKMATEQPELAFGDDDLGTCRCDGDN